MPPNDVNDEYLMLMVESLENRKDSYYYPKNIYMHISYIYIL